MKYFGLENLEEKNRGMKHPVRILVVDDDEDIALVLKKGLQLEGFDVDSSSDPVGVLKTYVAGKYDLLITDVRMPVMNGFELYREIRKIDKKVKVCFITAFEVYYDEFRRVFPKIHVSCFVQKPITIGQLANAVREELVRPIAEEEAVQSPTYPKEQLRR